MLGALGAQRRHVLEEGFRVGLDVVSDGLARVHRLVQDAVVDVGEVHHVCDAIPRHTQVSPDEVIEEESAEVADVRVVPHRRAARVHAHVAVLERLELFLGTRERVVESQRHGASLA